MARLKFSISFEISILEGDLELYFTLRVAVSLRIVNSFLRFLDKVGQSRVKLA